MLGLLIWILIGLTIAILPILALIDIVRSTFQTPDRKILWVLVVFLLPVLGSLLYFFVGVKQRFKR